MAYTFSKDSVRNRPKNAYKANKISSEDFVNNKANRTNKQERQFELAEVVDVIRTTEHADFKTNEDIGKAKVRRVYSEFNQNQETLGFAYPLNARYKSYPLEHELVLVAEFNELPFYIRTANWRTNPNQNTAPLFSVDKTGNDDGGYPEASAGIASSGGDEVNVEGEQFEVRKDVMPMRHRAGDTVVEGRFGNSVRLGRDENMNPIMQLRVGQREEQANAEFLTPFFEDVNEDPTSIYLTDEPVEFPLAPDDVSPELEPTTIDFEDHLFMAEETPDAYNNAQILMATNRIVMNAKDRQIMGFSGKDTNWVSLKNFTVDAKERIKTLSKQGNLHVSESYFDILTEGNVHINTESESENAARGQQTHDRLVETLQTLQVETHPTPCGPSGPPNQAGTYAQIEQKVRDTVRSEKIFVDEVGEDVSREMSPASE